jgi:hypothetical protein
LGTFPANGPTKQARWESRLFYLGRAFDADDEITLRYSETWFDREYFFGHFLRVNILGSGQEFAEVGVRLSSVLCPTYIAEMEWGARLTDNPSDVGPPRRVQQLEVRPDEWQGIQVPRPVRGKSYGLSWRSGVYDGEPSP